jgi:hypothetical protein
MNWAVGWAQPRPRIRGKARPRCRTRWTVSTTVVVTMIATAAHTTDSDVRISRLMTASLVSWLWSASTIWAKLHCQGHGIFESLPGHCDQSGRPPDYESCKREDGAGKPSDCGQTSLQHGIPFPANGAFDDEGASSTQWAAQDRERNARLMEFAETRRLPDQSP